ncbi:MAG TPA: chlorite dismutase family protein [Nitrolancea sp.]|nr:chlorite dismutase family protein [Nitrolancea sp.]
MSSTSSFTAFWLYTCDRDWRQQPASVRQQARAEFIQLLEAPGEGLGIRGVYSTIGYRADVDLIIWAVGSDAERIQDLATRIRRTALGDALDMKQAYIGVGTASQYDPEHGPAFIKGTPPARYLSVYPFVKTPEWYLLSYEDRRDLMKVHGQLGKEFPTILTNTVSSFGIQDQEFIVALEDDDPAVLVAMVQRLRLAEVRKYTQLDTPIYLGRLKDPAEALSDLE